MPSPFLAVRALSGGTAQIYSYVNTTPTVVGTAAGTVGTYNAVYACNNNSVANILGQLYYLSYNGLRASRDDGYSWEVKQSFTSLGTSNLGGLYGLTQTNGDMIWAAVYVSGVGLYSLIKSVDDGDTWTDTNLAISGNNSPTLPFNDKYIVLRMNNSSVLTIDVSTNAVQEATIVYPTSPVVWQNELYIVAAPPTQPLLQLTRITGSISTVVATLDTSQTYIINNNVQMTSWVDPTTGNLIVFARGDSGQKAFEIEPDFTVTDRTATMLTGGALAGYSSSLKINAVVVDQIDSVGSVPVVSLYITNNSTSGSPLSQFIYNGVGSLLGDGSGNPNSNGGTVNDALPYHNIDSLRNWTARVLDSVETSGTPSVWLTGQGGPLTGRIRVNFKAIVPRTAPLTTIGGSPAAYDLSTAPIPSVPIRPRSIALHGTISGTVEVALDDGAGNFPVSTLLPSGGTINYTTGAMTGTTASLDASTEVRAYWSGGTASVQMFRTLATDSYPADVITNTVNPAPLSNPSEGSISGDTNVNVPADGTVCTVDVDMTGFSSGDQVSIEPYIF